MKSLSILLSIVSSMILLLTASAPCSAQCVASGPPITVKIVNNSSVDSCNVYVLLTHDSSCGGDAVNVISFDTPTQLSTIPNGEFTTTQLTSGRLIFSYYGPVFSNQEPNIPSVRYDKVELTYPGAANLTAVDFFGIPFKLQSLDSNNNVLQTLAYYTSTNTLVPLLTALAPNTVVQTTCPATPGCTSGTPCTTGSFARVLSPSKIITNNYPSMQSYVSSVAGQTVTIAGTYEGNIPPTPNTYTYTGTFCQDGSITLSGTMTFGTPKTLKVDCSTLAAAIYTINGSYTVDNNQGHVSDNDVYAAIYRDLVSGFGFGYVGGKYGTNSNAWYGTTPYNPPYACARSSPSDLYFNQYASVIAANSDAYGFPFSDVNQHVQVGLNAGGTGPVDTLRITILPDDMLDTPIIASASSTDSSITIGWPAISGATGYKVSVSPPLVAQIIDAGTSTSTTISSLNPGTPYTVSVTASKGASSSEAIPVTITTTGSPMVVAVDANSVGWNFIPNFTGTFTGHTITFNGCEHLLSGTNQSFQFNGIPGEKNDQNAYVFEWNDANGHLVYNSVLYVNLNGLGTNNDGAQSNPCNYGGSGGPNCSGTLCYGIINQDPTKTFMAANQHTPTYDDTHHNLYLSIAPVGQRKFCQATHTLSDLNLDGVVGGADLTLLLAAWGACSAAPAPCIEDLNSDGFVTGADLAMMIAEWGTNQN